VNPCQADEPFRVRPVARDETRLFFDWANREGWNAGLHDAPCFHDADPDGLLVAELHGEPGAIISCVRYGDDFGFAGQYIVRSEFRGRGFGLRLYTAAMARLAGRNVGLDCGPDQAGTYERAGFRTAHHHIRYVGAPAGATAPGVTRLDAIPFDDVLAYDRQCFPGPRAAFLRSWLAQPESVALGFVREGALAGFGAVRRAVRGWRVGPLFADDDTAAEALLLALAKECGGPVGIDVPDAAAHPTAEELVKRHGLTEEFRCARMYTGGRPAVAWDKVFGVTSLELG
jgi:GNAT superfamily N-acetyltransferase